MKSSKIYPLRHGGFSHVLLPLLVMVMVGVGGTYFIVSSHATSRGWRPHHYTKAQIQAFALATSNYWNDPERVDQASYAQKTYVYSINSSEVTCKPGNVKIQYYNDLNSKAIAHSAEDGAVKEVAGKNWSPADKKAAREFNKKYYCKMWFNLAYQNQIESPGYACVIFMHEYGHMIGRQHNHNPDSPMYNGYVSGQGGSPESFYTNKMAIIKKSLCTPFSNGLF